MRRRCSRSDRLVLVVAKMNANLIVDVILDRVADLLADMRFYMLPDKRFNVRSDTGA